METTCVGSVRNVAVVSSAGAGKTSLCEALLYIGGAIPVLGSVMQGTTVSDFEPEALRHRTSTSASLLQFSWNHTQLTLLDTPGALALLGESMATLRAIDAVVLVMTEQIGVRTELARLWAKIKDLELPCLLFLNGLDKDDASLEKALELCRKQLDCMPVLMTVPVMAGETLDGVIDVRLNQFVRSGPSSAKAELLPVPTHLADDLSRARTKLVEAVAESREALLETYLAEGELSDAVLSEGLRRDIETRQVLPVYAGSATQNVGVWSLLDAMVSLLPSPVERGVAHPWYGIQPETHETCERKGSVEEPFSAYVFKTIIDPFVGRLSYCRVVSGSVQADSTVFNASQHSREKLGHFYRVFGKRHVQVDSAKSGDIVAIAKLKDTHTGDTLSHEGTPLCYPGLGLAKPVLAYAIEAKSKADIDKVSLGLHKLIEEDPALEFSRNEETKEMVLSGMGQFHIDLALEKLHRKFGVEVILHTPKIPYRETVKTKAQAQGKYKKQTGGHGQYGDCWLEVAPLPRGQGYAFENRVVGGAIPRNFIPAVEKGVHEAMREGPLSGCPVVDVRVAVYDGSYHVVDSSEMSFKIAGSMAFKKAIESAHPVLLEPVMTIEIDAPTETVGAVMGDLNARRGRILSVNAHDHVEQITALAPLSELLRYATALNALTAGRGSYVMEFAQYDEVPRDLIGKIVEKRKNAGHTVASYAEH
ncbi:MAG: elongation factor G [Nitrospira sp.]|nr:elongation factor G [Nitrospira sp.]